MTGIINTADVIVTLILLICIFAGWKFGLIRALMGFASNIIAIIVARLAVPYLAVVVRGTFIFDIIRDWVIENLGLQQAIEGTAQKAQVDLISALPLPDFLKLSLLENNNTEIYNMLDASGIAEYIGGYIANIIINIALMLIAMLVVWLAVPIICHSLKAIAELPVIKNIDHIFGAILGFLQATLIIWIGLVILVLFCVNPENNNIMDMINTSFITKQFYDYNILLEMITKII